MCLEFRKYPLHSPSSGLTPWLHPTIANSAQNQRVDEISGLAYVLMETIRRLALHDTELAHAQVGTLRLKLLKIGAIILRNTRRIRFLLSSAFPYQNLFYAAAKRLVPG